MPDDPTYVTETGRVLTEADIEAMADEAERGYDAALLRPPRRGRPLLGSGPAEVVPVRLDPDLRRTLLAKAETEATTLSEVIRRALRRYLGAA